MVESWTASLQARFYCAALASLKARGPCSLAVLMEKIIDQLRRRGIHPWHLLQID